jgi:hypothetical protein
VNREKWQLLRFIRRVTEEKSHVFSCQVDAIIDLRGHEFALDLLVKTVKVEMNGGLMIDDGSRRRTRGGVYIKLVRDKMNPEQKREFRLLTKEKLKARSARLRAESLARKNEALQAAAELELMAEPEMVEVVNASAPQVVARQPEPPKQKNEKSTKPSANNKRDFAASRQARFQMDTSDSLDVRDDLPPNVKAKLQQLQGAANVLRERVQQLEAKPVGQQVGLEMARKLLASNESQVAALLAQHERDSEVAS